MKTLLFIAFNIITGIVYSQNLQLNWINTLNSDGSNYVYSTLLDNNNNLYVSGIFSDTVDFDPSSNIVNKTSTFSSGDCYIAKYDSNGNLIWVKTFEGLITNSNTIIYSMQINSLDQLIVAGSLSGIVDLDPDAGVTARSSQGVTDILIAAYSTSGVLIWAKSIGGSDSENALKMKVTSTDDILIAGSFNGTTDFDPSGTTSNLTTTGNLDGFFAKYSFDGTFTWAKKIGSANIDYIHGMAIDANDNISICGQFKGTADMNPGVGINNITSNNGSYDMFIGYFDDSGNYMWAFPLGNSDSDVARCIDFDINNNVIISGGFRGTVDFDPSPSTFNLTSNPATSGSDIVVSRYSPSGSFRNAFYFGGTNTDTPQSLKFINNKIHLLGYYYYDIDFDPSSVQQNYSAISTGWFLSNYELDGTFNDVLVLGNSGSASDFGAYDFEIDASDNLYFTGQYKNTTVPLDFNPNGTSINMPYEGGWDGFFAKYSACTNTSSIDIIVACESHTWIDGNTYSSSNNTASHSLTNVAGCDSVVTLNLTITNSNAGTAVVASCDSYTWIDGNTYSVSNNTATHTLTNVTGCDSVVTLNLTINSSYNQSENITICNNENYTLPNGSVVNNNGTYFSNLTSISGCDSIIETVLNVISPNITTSLNGVTITANAFTPNYQWLDCNNNYQEIVGETSQSFTATVNGSYAVSVSENGCIDTSACITISDVGVETNSVLQFTVYPNPAQTQIFVTGNFPVENLILLDLTGRIVKTNFNVNSIYVGDLQRGTYVLEAYADGKKTLQQIIIQ